MFTVSRLGIDGRLAKPFVTSTPVESMISIARTTNRNVTRWRDGTWCCVGPPPRILNAERSFRRIKGYKQMPQLSAALHRHAHPDTASSTETVESRRIEFTSDGHPSSHETRDILRGARAVPSGGSGRPSVPVVM